MEEGGQPRNQANLTENLRCCRDKIRRNTATHPLPRVDLTMQHNLIDRVHMFSVRRPYAKVNAGNNENPIQKASAEDQRPSHLRTRLKITNKYMWNVLMANVNKTYRCCISYHPTFLGPRVRTPDCTNGALPRVALDPREKQSLASAIDRRRDSNVELSRPPLLCLF